MNEDHKLCLNKVLVVVSKSQSSLIWKKQPYRVRVIWKKEFIRKLIQAVLLRLEKSMVIYEQNNYKRIMDYNQMIHRRQPYFQDNTPHQQLRGESTERGNDRKRRLSQPKTRINLIKINKNRLPADFFQNKELSNRRIPSLRVGKQQQRLQSLYGYKKAESERLHYSPEKTSFFGSFEDQEPVSAGLPPQAHKVSSRKFQTRQEPKRDAFAIDHPRKLTTAVKAGKNQFLQLFPSTHDKQLADIIISSSKTKNFKLSPRKQYINKARQVQPLIDPQKQTINIKQKQEIWNKQNQTIRLSNSCPQQSKQGESLNITFYNAKSSCFPPINRH